MFWLLLTILSSYFLRSFGNSSFCRDPARQVRSVCDIYPECMWNTVDGFCGSACDYQNEPDCTDNLADCRWIGSNINICILAWDFRVDICYVVDTSLSITIPEWENIQQFLIESIKVLSQKPPSQSQTHAGVVTYDSYVTTVFNVLRLSSNPTWEQDILDAQCFQQRKAAGNNTGGATWTVLGVTRCLDLLDFSQQQDPSDVAILVLATDGRPNGPVSCIPPNGGRRALPRICEPCEVDNLNNQNAPVPQGSTDRNDYRILDKGYKTLNIYLKAGSELTQQGIDDDLACLVKLNQPQDQVIAIDNGTLNDRSQLLKKIGEFSNVICAFGPPSTLPPTLSPSVAAGDPVVTTFDGYEYEWQGLCSYVLSMDCDDQFNARQLNSYEKFKIIGTNKPCDLGTCIGSIIVFLKEPKTKKLIRVDFLQDEVKIDGNVVTITEDKAHSFGGDNFKLSLVDKPFKDMDEYHLQFDLGSFEMLNNATEENYRLDTSFGISIEWNGYSKVMFDISSFDFESTKTCGLLGHKDDNARNDLRFPDGSKVEVFPVDAADDFEESWLIQSFVHHWLDRQSHDPKKCKSSTPRKLCDGSKSKQQLAKTMCEGFIDSTLENPKCKREVDADEKKMLLDTCSHDLCFCYNDDIFACGRFLHKYLQNQMECDN